VLKVAAEKGYRSDPLVASLMTRLRVSRAQRESEKIAFLTPWDDRKQRQHAMKCDYNFTCFREGIWARAEQLGYDVEEFSAKELGITLARLSKILYARGIRGVIVAPLWRAHGHFSLEWQHFAAATVTYTITKPEMNRVTHSHFDGMQTALRHLKRLGYRRPGFVTARDQNERVRRAWEGSYLAYSPTDSIPPFLPKTLELEDFRKWFERYEPDVVLSNQLMPLSFLQQLDYEIPKRVGFASLDLMPGSFLGFESLAGIDQMPRLQGEATADLLIKQMQNNQFGLPENPLTLQMVGAWRDGPTLRRIA